MKRKAGPGQIGFAQIEDVPRARVSDPPESHTAGRRVKNVNRLQRQVLSLLQLSPHPLADEELVAAFRRAYPDIRVSDQNIRSRRAELCRKDFVRADPDQTHITKWGRPAARWRAVKGAALDR